MLRSNSSSYWYDSPSRRDFLRKAGLTAGGLLTLTVPNLLGKWVDPAVAASELRSYTPGKVALELDGQFAGFVSSVAGGNAVATTGPGLEKFPRTQVPNVVYEPITVVFGPGMSKAWYDWISATLDMKVQPRNGAVLGMDYDFVEHSRMNFMNALITEITFPAFDAASKDLAVMTVKLAPGTVRVQMPPAGGVKYPFVSKTSTIFKAWSISNFRLFIQGLEQATQMVNRIEALTITFNLPSAPVGQFREPQRGLPGIALPNLVITLPEAHAAPFYQWHDFVMKGNRGPEGMRSGVLQWLAPDMQTVLGSLQFSNLAIFKITPEKVLPGAEAIRRVTVEMYCQRIAAAFPAPLFN